MPIIFADKCSSSTMNDPDFQLTASETSSDDGEEEQNSSSSSLIEKTEDVHNIDGNMNEGKRKRKKADINEWKHNKNQKLRMKGKAYIGFTSDKNNNIKQDILRQARKISLTCNSNFCNETVRSLQKK